MKTHTSQLLRKYQLFQHHNYVCNVLINSKKKRVMLCNLFVVNSICLATRSEAEEAMRELRSGGGLAILTTKQIVAGSEEIEFEVKTPQGLSTMEALPTLPWLCSVSTKSTAFPMRGRQPRPDRSQLPHTGSRSLVRSLWTSDHPDPEGPMVSKWWPGFRKTTSRGSSVSSLVPSLSKATPACTRMSHSQSNSTSRRL